MEDIGEVEDGVGAGAVALRANFWRSAAGSTGSLLEHVSIISYVKGKKKGGRREKGGGERERGKRE